MNMKKVASIALAGVMTTSVLVGSAMAASTAPAYSTATQTVLKYDNQIASLRQQIKEVSTEKYNLWNNYNTLSALDFGKVNTGVQASMKEINAKIADCNKKIFDLLKKLSVAQADRQTVIDTGMPLRALYETEIFYGGDEVMEADAATNVQYIVKAVKEVVGEVSDKYISLTYNSVSADACYYENNDDLNALNQLKSKLGKLKGEFAFNLCVYPGDTADIVADNFLTISIKDSDGTMYVYTGGHLYQM